MKTCGKNSGFTPLETIATRVPVRSNRRLLTGFTPLETISTRIPLWGKGEFLTGFTLIEMMLVLAIIVLLVSMIVGIAKRVDDQGKERLCRDTIALVGNALEQFRDFGYEYKSTLYNGLYFPLDCNNFNVTDLQNTLQTALYPLTNPLTTVVISPIASHDPNFSGSESLYFILSQVPDCRTTLDKIDKSLLTNKGTDGTPIIITINPPGTTQTLPFTRIIDPWGTTLRYDYYNEFPFPLPIDLGLKKTFPVITSAGPDKTFDTDDDISNINQK